MHRDLKHIVCLVWFPQAHHYSCERTLPGHLRWIQKADYQLQLSSRPSCLPSLEQAQGQSAAQAHRSLGGQFGIHLYLLNIDKTYTQNSTPLGTQGRGGSIENTAQGRQQEHLLSDSQKRGGGEEERGFISLD